MDLISISHLISHLTDHLVNHLVSFKDNSVCKMGYLFIYLGIYLVIGHAEYTYVGLYSSVSTMIPYLLKQCSVSGLWTTEFSELYSIHVWVTLHSL